MHTELFSLSKIFTENIYRIPDYQRGYSWTERQLKDFWSDLILLDVGRDHYTGVLTLEEVATADSQRWTDDVWILDSKRYRPYYVVDGQQRLTTSLILLQALLEQLKQDDQLNYSTIEEIRKKYIFESRDKGVSRSYIFGYEKDNPSYEFLKTRIFLESSDNHEIGEQTIYTHNLLVAKTYFTDKLQGLSLRDLETLFTKLTQHFLFNIYTISGGIDVFVAFETMNNRGKPLSHLELLKNRLIFLSTRLEVDATERARVRSVVNEAWKTAYHFLGRNQQRPLNDDRFLSNHFILYVLPNLYDDKASDEKAVLTRRARMQHLRQEDEYKNYLLDTLFTSRNIQRASGVEAKVPEPDSDEDKITTPSLTTQSLYDYAHDIKKCVQMYYRILTPEDSEFADDQKLVLTQINRLGWFEALPLVLAIALKTKGPAFTEFLRTLERYIFMRFLITPARFPRGLDGKDLEEVAIRWKKKPIPIKEVTNELKSTIEKHIPQFSTTDIISESFRHGYYAWRIIKFFLFEYEQELKRKSRAKRDKVTWEEFMGEHFAEDYATVEHIYPQRPTGESWKKHFDGFNQKEKSALKNSLGNLVALSRPKNSALGNRSFAEKKKGAGDTTGYISGSYSEIEVHGHDEWTPECILERGLKMLTFMEKRWQFKFKDRAARVKALGLSFLEEKRGS